MNVGVAWLVACSACSYRAPASSIDPPSDAAPLLDSPDVVADACGAECAPRSCAEILADNPTAPSGVYQIDLDRVGPEAPFDVECDMTTPGEGWTVVGRELGGGNGGLAGPLRFLGIDSMNATPLAAGTESGSIGVRFAGAYTSVRITWGTSFIQFSKPGSYDMFSNMVRTAIDIADFSTNDPELATWVANANGARLCVASRSADVRPGDTSWAIKPRDDNRVECGCNDPSFQGHGAYYGGTPNGQQTACTGFGGGWAGVKDNGEQKGGVTLAVETRILIR